MSVASSGYDGTVSEVQWAGIADLAGTAYAVAAAGDLAVTAAGAGDRAVTVAAGTAFGHGVKDVFTGTTVLNATSVGSGTRWDTVVVRRIWTLGGGTGTSLAIVVGSSTKAVTKAHSTPGNADDQPIALIQLTSGSTSITQLESLVPSGGKSLYVPTVNGISAGYTAPPGALWYVAANGHQWISTPSGATDLDAPNWVTMTLPGSGGDALLLYNVTPQYGLSRGHVEFKGNVKRTTGALIKSTYATNGTADPLLSNVPAGFRPGSTRTFMVPELGGTSYARCAVGSNGNVTVFADGRDVIAVDLSVIRYAAEL